MLFLKIVQNPKQEKFCSFPSVDASCALKVTTRQKEHREREREREREHI